MSVGRGVSRETMALGRGRVNAGVCRSVEVDGDALRMKCVFDYVGEEMVEQRVKIEHGAEAKASVSHGSLVVYVSRYR